MSKVVRPRSSVDAYPVIAASVWLTWQQRLRITWWAIAHGSVPEHAACFAGHGKSRSAVLRSVISRMVFCTP